MVRRGPKWSPNFIRGDPVGSIRKEKILTKIGGKLDIDMLHFFWYILVLARYKIEGKNLI